MTNSKTRTGSEVPPKAVDANLKELPEKISQKEYG
jgi:hypothetical protein